MPACARFPESAAAFLLLIALLVAGCTGPGKENRFQLTGVDAQWASGRISVDCRQQLTLSDEARDALIHGVPLTIQLELLLRDNANQARVGEETSSYEIRYLPLSDHYQLSSSTDASIKTFPRLRHALAELSRLEVTFETGILPSGEYRLLARTSLDQKKMPPPMRLPVLLSSSWRHDSFWSSWPLEIEPEA